MYKRFIKTLPFALLASSTTCISSLSTSSCSPVVTNYKKLTEKLIEIENLQGISGLLGWDEMTMLKDGGVDARNDQKAYLSGVIQEKQTSVELKTILLSIEKDYINSNELSNFDKANIRDAIRDYDMATKKSKELAMKEAKLSGEAYGAWVKAKTADDFAIFAPKLQEIVEIKKEIASVTFPNLSLYDANIENFERGMVSSRINEIFTSIKPSIVKLIKDISLSKVKMEYVCPEALKGSSKWDLENQKLLCLEIAEAIGFDFQKGRLDVSPHPFTGGPHATDVRITTRYSEENWLEGIAGTVHEVGHALYEQGRPIETQNNLPVSRALSMGIHESQSLFWERNVFQSKEFWEFLTPKIHKFFPHTKDVTAEEFYLYCNQVSPGFIRVDADEVTYPLHIVLRFELEQGLFGDLKVDDLPTVWNKKVKDMLGLTVTSDKVGVLQGIIIDHRSL